MSETTPIVFVIDDDASVRKSLERLLRSAGHRAEVFASASDFLRRERYAGAGCLILDVQMPGLNGLELQETLALRGCGLPIVFITGHGDIPMSVRAMKGGALDFLSKPFSADVLLKAVGEAVARCRQEYATRTEAAEIGARLATLTPREHEVLRHVVTGKLNKQIAADLGTAEKTVKVHRGRVMRKLKVHSVAELVRIAEKAGFGPA